MEKSVYEAEIPKKIEEIDVFAQNISQEIANLREIREGGYLAHTLHDTESFNEIVQVLEDVKEELTQDYELTDNERYNTPEFKKIKDAGYEKYFGDLENKLAELSVAAEAAGLPEEIAEKLKQAEKICAKLKIKFEL